MKTLKKTESSENYFVVVVVVVVVYNNNEVTVAAVLKITFGCQLKYELCVSQKSSSASIFHNANKSSSVHSLFKSFFTNSSSVSSFLNKL